MVVKTPWESADQLFSQPLKHCSFAPRAGNIIMLLCKELFSQPSENCLAAVLLLLRPRSHAAAEGASLSMQTHTIGPVQASFLIHTTGSAHINVWQLGLKWAIL